jgi:hypothetical protein
LTNTIDENGNGNVKLNKGIFADNNRTHPEGRQLLRERRTLANHNLDGDVFTDSDRTRSTQTDESGVDGGVNQTAIYSNLNASTEDANETGFHMFSNTNEAMNGDFDYQADNSNVTDDEYDAGLKEARTIV